MGTFRRPAAMMWIYSSLVDVVVGGGLLYLSTLSYWGHISSMFMLFQRRYYGPR